jgi:hypothetical protein
MADIMPDYAYANGDIASAASQPVATGSSDVAAAPSGPSQDDAGNALLASINTPGDATQPRNDADTNIGTASTAGSFMSTKGGLLADAPGGQLVLSLAGMAASADQSGPTDPFSSAINVANNALSPFGMVQNVRDMMKGEAPAADAPAADTPAPEAAAPDAPAPDAPAPEAPAAEAPAEAPAAEAPAPDAPAAKAPAPETSGAKAPAPETSAGEAAGEGGAMEEALGFLGDASSVVGAFASGWGFGQSWDQKVKEDGSAGKDESGNNRSWSDKEGDDATAAKNWVLNKLGGGTAGEVVGDVAAMGTVGVEAMYGTGKALNDLPGMAADGIVSTVKDDYAADKEEKGTVDNGLQKLSPTAATIAEDTGADYVLADIARTGKDNTDRLKNIADATGATTLYEQQKKDFEDHPVQTAVEDLFGVGFAHSEVEAHQQQIQDAATSANNDKAGTAEKALDWLDGRAELKAGLGWMDVDVSDM